MTARQFYDWQTAGGGDVSLLVEMLERHEMPWCMIDGPPTIRYRSAMTVKVVVERGEDGYFVAHCPSLRSCWSQGKTRDEALQNLREAIALYLEPAPGQVVAGEQHEVVELT